MIKRVLAQVEVLESNSMIEAFWRSLRHQWRYLHELDALDGIRPLVKFYVEQHNGVMPHAVFNGYTPDDMFFAVPSNVPKCSPKCAQRRVNAGLRLSAQRHPGGGNRDDLPSDSKGGGALASG